MGMDLRAGKNREPGPDRLSRLMRAPERTRPPDGEDETPDADPAVERWGATAMPDWLDSGAGRRRWSERQSASFEILDDDLDHVDESPRSLNDDDDDDWDERKHRWTMLPRAAIGLVAVGLIGCAFAGYTLLRENEPVAPLVAFEQSVEPKGSPSAGQASTPPPTEMVISVVGMVSRPGLVRLRPGSRVADALDRAGGAREGADLLSLNLAQVVHDGDQILVGRSGGDQVRSAVVTSGDETTTAPGGSLPTGDGRQVDLNTATEAQLDELPGVGPVTAQAIIAWRSTHGRFTSVDQLAEVDGIGPSRLAKLRPLVTVG
ncbi:competence protein ComEA [Gordonia malaquae]|uniref:Putative DNA-binding protein n=1 Tax=Gordonia malaquae NBRC 108250 TaxID=1223542 RepID=M3UN11_GORML|nr:helix-hairpin-helix domain-containing protein [Gordonia malaquae]GAC81380.1 putative DNA-binding protein [Gordonia malaquae NBRC 108250]SED73465.1 competence protein ComEA [Gordonia malaquae]